MRNAGALLLTRRRQEPYAEQKSASVTLRGTGFDTISEAKKYAQDSGLTGAFNLLGDNYRDAWYVSQSKQEQV